MDVPLPDRRKVEFLLCDTTAFRRAFGAVGIRCNNALLRMPSTTAEPAHWQAQSLHDCTPKIGVLPSGENIHGTQSSCNFVER